MNQIFDYDSPVLQVLNRFASLVVLNLLCLCTSIPIFTIGASVTALYDVVFRMDGDWEHKNTAAFFRAFRKNFRQSTLLWLLFLLLMIASIVNAMIFSNMGGTVGFLLFLLSLAVLCNSLLILGYVFPLLSQFENTVGNTLKNAALLSIANLPRTLLMAVLNCFPWVLIFMHLYAFFRLGFLWLTLYFAAAAYVNSRLLKKVLDPLRSQPSGH